MEEENEALLEGGEELVASEEGQVEEGQQQAKPEAASPKETDAERGLRAELIAERKQRQQYERQMMAFMRDMRPQKEPEAPKPPPSIYEDEDQAFGARLTPIQREIQELRATVLRQEAVAQYSRESFSEAEKAFNEATSSRTIDPADYHAIQNASNPFAAAIQWHQRTRVMSETGGSLEGYQAKLLSDPAFLEKAAAAYAKLKQPDRSAKRDPVFAVPSLNRAPAKQAVMSDDDYMAALRG